MQTPILSATPSFAWPTLDFAPGKLVALTDSLIDSGVAYHLGAKADPLSLQAGDIEAIDCSGFVRWAIFHATCGTPHPGPLPQGGRGLEIPDGSENQHEWARSQGLKPSTVPDGSNLDDAVRIAFLEPTGDEPGHVMLIVNGRTCESHGGRGVDRREWQSCPFMARCSVYVLTAPTTQGG